MQKSQNDCLEQLKNSLCDLFLDVFESKQQRNLVQLVEQENYHTPPFKGNEPWITMPDQIGIMLMWLHPDVLQMIVRKAVQRGMTEIAVAAHMLLVERGESSVYVMPNAEMAAALDKSIKHWQTYGFIRDRMLADPDKMKDTRNKIKEKQYTTCSQYFFGAGGAGATSQYTVSFATADEAEKIEGDPQNQGSVWAGFDGRFAGLLRPGRKRIFSSPQSPDGIISELLEDCDHIMQCEIPCPLCGEFSVLWWGEKQDGWGIKFDDQGTVEERAESVRHVCRHCKKGWDQKRYKEVIGDCRWVSESGYYFDCNEGADGDFKMRIDGKALGSDAFNDADFKVVDAPYKIGLQHTADGCGLYGRSDWSGAVRNCIDYTDVLKNRKNDTHIKRFINEFRAKAYKPKDVREIPTHELLKRRQKYKTKVPAEVQFLVAGVDFGLDYSEYEIVGIGSGMSTYPIERRKIDGDSDNRESRMFTEVDEMLRTALPRGGDGRMLSIMLCIMDGRYAQKNVRRLASLDAARRIVVYGDGKSDPRKPLFQYDPKKPEKNWLHLGYGEDGREIGCFEVTINPHEASRQLYARLAVPKGKPGYYHIPYHQDYGKLWADALTSDKRREKDGRIFYGKDHSGIRGEAHDTGKYCVVASVVVVESGQVVIDDNFTPTETPLPENVDTSTGEVLEPEPAKPDPPTQEEKPPPKKTGAPPMPGASRSKATAKKKKGSGFKAFRGRG